MIALDTDVVIDILRSHPPALVWLRQVQGEVLYLPGLVMMEIYQGCRDKRDQRRVVRALTAIPLLWPTPTDCDRALKDFAKFHLSHAIGLIDCLIAHTAIGYGLQLATFNDRHYSCLPQLASVQPYGR